MCLKDYASFSGQPCGLMKIFQMAHMDEMYRRALHKVDVASGG